MHECTGYVDREGTSCWSGREQEAGGREIHIKYLARSNKHPKTPGKPS